MKKRHVVLLFLVLLSVITFLDRIAISVAADRIKRELNIDTARWGWVLGSFVLCYALFEIPNGALGDRFGPRKVLTRVVVWWTAFTALTGLSQGFFSLITTRIFFGIGEAGAYPNISSALASWFAPTSRAQAQGWIWGSSRLGGALAPLIVVPLQVWLGWRITFGLLGVIGAAWAVAFFAWYRDNPRDQPGITSAELAEMPPAVPMHEKTNWSELLRSRQMQLLFAGYFFYGWGPWFYFSWYPLYIMKTAHLSEREMGFVAAIPYVLGFLANMIGGPVFDKLAATRGFRFAGRIVCPAGLLGTAVLMFAMTQIHNRLALLIISPAGLGVCDFMVPAAWAVAMNMGGQRAGTVTGAMNTAGNLGGFVCSVLAGQLVQSTGSYNAPVMIVAGVLVVAALLFARVDGSVRIFQAQGRSLN